MKLFRKIMVLWLICMLTAACSSSYASEGTSIELLNRVLSMDEVVDVAYGITEILEGAFTVSIPEDWEKLEIDKVMGEDVLFHYMGKDSEDREVYFGAIAIDCPFDSIQEVIQSIREMDTEYRLACLNDIDVIITGDDEQVLCMCFTENGRTISLTFGYLPTSVYYKTLGVQAQNFSDIIRSDKLCRDMAAILQSLKPTGNVKMKEFEVY